MLRARLQDLRWYYVSGVGKTGKTARISLLYAPAGPAVALRICSGRPLPPIPRRGVPLQRSATATPAMFDAHFPDLTMLAPTLGVLTAMITPAILIPVSYTHLTLPTILRV